LTRAVVFGGLLGNAEKEVEEEIKYFEPMKARALFIVFMFTIVITISPQG
jgi:hypothetical protein